MNSNYIPFKITTWNEFVSFDPKKRDELCLEHNEVNKKYIEEMRGDSLWVGIGAKSGKVIARGNNHESYPRKRKKKDMSEKAGELVMFYVEPVKSDLDEGF